MPLALVVLLTLRSGLEGLGEAALTLSLWQFLLVVCDFGVSQWLLTKERVTRREVWGTLIGRLGVGMLAAGATALLVWFGVLRLSAGAMWALAASLILGVGQMAFAWALQQGQRRKALLLVIAEYLFPLPLLLCFDDPVASLVSVMLGKTATGLALTAYVLITMHMSADQAGLPPRAFGLHSSAWALTSVASGTGELMLLSGPAMSVLAGAYRIFQTIASLGGTVGFAALAPLMSRESRKMESISRPMLGLGLLSAAILALAILPGFLLTAQAIGGHELWALLVCLSLGATAVLNTMSIAPLSAVAREQGSKYIFRIGLVSSGTYWGTIIVLFALEVPLLAPVAPLAAAIVGFAGNLYVWRVDSRTRRDSADGSADTDEGQ